MAHIAYTYRQAYTYCLFLNFTINTHNQTPDIFLSSSCCIMALIAHWLCYVYITHRYKCKIWHVIRIRAGRNVWCVAKFLAGFSLHYKYIQYNKLYRHRPQIFCCGPRGSAGHEHGILGSNDLLPYRRCALESVQLQICVNAKCIDVQL